MINPMLQRALARGPSARHNIRDILFQRPGAISCECGWVCDAADQFELERVWKLHLKEVGQKTR